MAKNKPHFNLIFIGHVDHGKSTTVGRIMFDSGSVNEQAMRKLKDKATELGKSGFEFAFVMDNLKEERERGVTIDLAHQKFETDKYYFTIIDAPGHRDFVKNMITGANQADAAVLMCAADDGVNAQTREHAFLSRTFGITQIIVAVNKMDKVNYDEKRYKEVEVQMNELLKKAGFKADDIKIVPIASLTGDNVYKKTDKMPWWSGKTLVEMFDDLTLADKPVDLPLRLPIQDVYNIQGIGCVPVGRVETGIMKPGQKVTAIPGKTGKGVSGEVKSIEMHHEQLSSAEPGDNVGFNLRGIGKNDIARGDVLCESSKPAAVVEEFDAQIVVINHPSVITVGYTPVLHAHTAQVACQFVDLGGKDMLKTGDVAKVKLRPTKPFVIESSADNKYLSRFAIRDMGATVGAGVVTAVKKREL